jgi:queuine tRNA-ribosyltransferase
MTAGPLQFEVLHTDSSTAARAARATTPHGSFDTPAFMPVGTQASVKGMLPDNLRSAGAQILLANIDGSLIFLDAARSIAVQNDLGADIIMAFDQCPAADAPAEAHQAAVKRTLRWAEQSLAAHSRRADQALFGIVQGGVDMSLRESCARALVEMNFDGYALGGLAVGEGFAAMEAIVRQATPILPANRPRYLMGVGYPRDIVAAVAAGIDMFDCVLPTRNGRNAYAFTPTGPLRLRNAQFQRDTAPIEPGCDCPACLRFSRGTLRHLFYAGEMLGPILVSVHNIRFYQRLMADIRRSIACGEFDRWRREDSRCSLGPADAAEASDLND